MHKLSEIIRPKMTSLALSILFTGLGLFTLPGVNGVFSNHNKERVIDTTAVTISVVTGSTAKLPCAVDPRYTVQYAEQYKVMWVNPSETAVSLGDRRILNDNRMSVERQELSDWNLYIRNVSLTDAGVYKCQINTRPVGTKFVNLTVREPPSIIDHTNPTEIIRPEGLDVEFICTASGTPPPTIVWYRLHSKTTQVKEQLGSTGEVLSVKNITRECADAYICEASNGVESSASQTMKLVVEYAPLLTLANRRMGQFKGGSTILECIVTAFPLATAFWRHANRPDMELKKDSNFDLGVFSTGEGDDITLALTIRVLRKEDYGEYECVANNQQGTTVKKMILYETYHRTTTTTTTTTAPRGHAWSSRSEIIDVTRQRHGNSLPHLANTGNRGKYEDDRMSGEKSRSGDLYQEQINSYDQALRSHVTSDGKTTFTDTKAHGGVRDASSQVIYSILLSVILPMSLTIFNIIVPNTCV